MEWLFGSFFVLILALLLYSIISTSSAIRKKAQPSLDSFFDALYAIVLLKKAASKGNSSDNPERKSRESG